MLGQTLNDITAPVGSFASGVAKKIGFEVSDNILDETIGNRGVFPHASDYFKKIPPILEIPNPFEFLKEFVQSLAEIVKKFIDSVGDKIEYIINNAANKLNETVIKVANKFEEVSKNIIANAKDTFRDLLEKAINDIKLFLKDIFSEVRDILGEANKYIEDRISQIATIIATSIDKVTKIAENFNPSTIYKDLVSPALQDLSRFKEQLISDINQILDKLIDETDKRVNQALIEKEKLFIIIGSKLAKNVLRAINLSARDIQIGNSNYYKFKKAYVLAAIAVDGDITPEELCQAYNDIQVTAIVLHRLNKDKLGNDSFYAREWLKYGQKYQETTKFHGVKTDSNLGDKPSFLELLYDKYKDENLSYLKPVNLSFEYIFSRISETIGDLV